MQKIRRLFFTAVLVPLFFAQPRKVYALQNKNVQTIVNDRHISVSKTVQSSPSSVRKSITLQTEKLPRIPRLSSYDDIFKQYGADVEENYKRAAAGKIKSVQFYTYTPTADDTLFTVAAACSIPYETIATVNGIENIGGMTEGKTIILPTDAGLFVPETPESSIEILIEKKYFPVMENLTKEWYSIDGRRFYFLHGERFGSTERAYFLDADFKMPLDASWLSSAYGMRMSPLSGEMRFHRGIDLAAAEGALVYSCKSGSVIRCTKGDPIYGNYVVLKHDKGMTSIYAHLSDVFVREGDIVTGRARIGRVGKTGAATGPHLHFEIRINGVSTDPRGLLPDYGGRQGR